MKQMPRADEEARGSYAELPSLHNRSHSLLRIRTPSFIDISCSSDWHWCGQQELALQSQQSSLQRARVSAAASNSQRCSKQESVLKQARAKLQQESASAVASKSGYQPHSGEGSLSVQSLLVTAVPLPTSLQLGCRASCLALCGRLLLVSAVALAFPCRKRLPIVLLRAHQGED